MFSRLRSFVAALTIAALLTAYSGPALAGALQDDDMDDMSSSVPVVVDVLVLRPLGLLMTAGGILFYAFPVLPLTAITRPTQIFKPLGPLVADPARFTFSDPLGHH
jgi:hypothetical protein